MKQYDVTIDVDNETKDTYRFNGITMEDTINLPQPIKSGERIYINYTESQIDETTLKETIKPMKKLHTRIYHFMNKAGMGGSTAYVEYYDGDNTFELSTAICHKSDQYSKKKGGVIAKERFESVMRITVPIYKKDGAVNLGTKEILEQIKYKVQSLLYPSI